MDGRGQKIAEGRCACGHAIEEHTERDVRKTRSKGRVRNQFHCRVIMVKGDATSILETKGVSPWR